MTTDEQKQKFALGEDVTIHVGYLPPAMRGNNLGSLQAKVVKAEIESSGAINYFLQLQEAIPAAGVLEFPLSGLWVREEVVNIEVPDVASLPRDQSRIDRSKRPDIETPQA